MKGTNVQAHLKDFSMSTHKDIHEESFARSDAFDYEQSFKKHACFSEDHQAANLFERKVTLWYNFQTNERSVLAVSDIRVNSVRNFGLEEYKEHDDVITTNKANSDSFKNELQEDDFEIKKPKNTDKERARRARQRKKQYYQDMEKRLEYLEK